MASGVFSAFPEDEESYEEMERQGTSRPAANRATEKANNSPPASLRRSFQTKLFARARSLSTTPPRPPRAPARARSRSQAPAPDPARPREDGERRRDRREIAALEARVATLKRRQVAPPPRHRLPPAAYLTPVRATPIVEDAAVVDDAASPARSPVNNGEIVFTVGDNEAYKEHGVLPPFEAAPEPAAERRAERSFDRLDALEWRRPRAEASDFDRVFSAVDHAQYDDAAEDGHDFFELIFCSSRNNPGGCGLGCAMWDSGGDDAPVDVEPLPTGPARPPSGLGAVLDYFWPEEDIALTT